MHVCVWCVVCMYVCLYVCMYECLCVCVYVYSVVCVCIMWCVYVCLCVCGVYVCVWIFLVAFVFDFSGLSLDFSGLLCIVLNGQSDWNSSVDQAGLELRDLLASAYRELGLKACTV